MVTKPTNRKWIIWMLKEFHPGLHKSKVKRRRMSFADIVAEVKHDQDVLNLFKYAGRDYRDPGAWYPLIGLLAELVAPDAIPVPGTIKKKKIWTVEKGQLLLRRYDEYRSRYKNLAVEGIFTRMQKDHPDWYPLKPKATEFDQSEAELRRRKAKTLARQRRSFLSI